MNKAQATRLRLLIADYSEAYAAVQTERTFHGKESEESRAELRKARLELDDHIDSSTAGSRT